MILFWYFLAIASLLFCALVAFVDAVEAATSGRYVVCSLEILLTPINGGTATLTLCKLLNCFRSHR